MFDTILVETDPRGVCTLTLNRPEKRNAMSALMMDELTEAAARLGADDAVRVVLLRGAGKTFCAGGDLGWMQEQINNDSAGRAAAARKLAEMLDALNRMPKPLIGAIAGNAFGGGVGLASICDVAFAVPGTKFALTETRLGLIPATIGPYVVARLGEGMARRVFMSSRVFDAVEAEKLGLVVLVEDLEAAVTREVTSYLTCAPGAVAEAKALALAMGGAPGKAEIDASIEALVTRWESPESADGVAAFFEKRKASWATG